MWLILSPKEPALTASLAAPPKAEASLVAEGTGVDDVKVCCATEVWDAILVTISVSTSVALFEAATCVSPDVASADGVTVGVVSNVEENASADDGVSTGTRTIDEDEGMTAAGVIDELKPAKVVVAAAGDKFVVVIEIEVGADIGGIEIGVKDAGVKVAGVKVNGVKDTGAMEIGVKDIGVKVIGATEMGVKDIGVNWIGVKESGMEEMGVNEPAGVKDSALKDSGVTVGTAPAPAPCAHAVFT